MKKSIKNNVLAVAIATLAIGIPYACARTYESNQIEQTKRTYLLDFVHYCQGCENLRQINPAKDYTKSTTHDLVNLASFYESQYNFADCTDYEQMEVIDDIIKK